MPIHSITEGADQFLFTLLGDLYGWGKSFIQRITKPGMYEVLNYETSLEILDPKGRDAILTKTEEVRFQQNNIIAFQDQAWGDGKILVDYQCTPGTAVDFYRSGHKTHVLISLRDVKQKGDQTNFRIQWKIKNGFLKSNGYWATDVNHFTQSLQISIIFPKEKPPSRFILVESNSQKTKELPREMITQLPDKCWQMTWEKRHPRLNEHYILKWEW